jgi:hypothetical protein
MLRGISSTGPHGQAKQCVINAFDTYYLLSVDDVMAIILHLAHNMDEDTPRTQQLPTSHHLPSPPLSLLAAVHTAVKATLHVGLAVVADYPPSEAHAAVRTTSCPPALPRMTLSCGGHSRSAKLSSRSTAPLVAHTLRTQLCCATSPPMLRTVCPPSRSARMNTMTPRRMCPSAP